MLKISSSSPLPFSWGCDSDDMFCNYGFGKPVFCTNPGMLPSFSEYITPTLLEEKQVLLAYFLCYMYTCTHTHTYTQMLLPVYVQSYYIHLVDIYMLLPLGHSQLVHLQMALMQHKVAEAHYGQKVVTMENYQTSSGEDYCNHTNYSYLYKQQIIKGVNYHPIQ